MRLSVVVVFESVLAIKGPDIRAPSGIESVMPVHAYLSEWIHEAEEEATAGGGVLRTIQEFHPDERDHSAHPEGVTLTRPGNHGLYGRESACIVSGGLNNLPNLACQQREFGRPALGEGGIRTHHHTIQRELALTRFDGAEDQGTVDAFLVLGDG